VSDDGTPTRGTAQPCAVHKTHRPASHVNEIHHVWPLGDGGPNVPENKVVVCATGHNSIHDLLNKWRRGVPDKAVLAAYSVGERSLAKLGWDRIQRGAL
jgi:hypothetical protein